MKVIVGVAEMKISSSQDDVLVTHGLGSCLGIAVHDPAARVGGILHAMMPIASASPEKAQANPFMFVDSGVPLFLTELERAGATLRRCRIAVVGGASINANATDHFEIGKRNWVTLKKTLWKLGVLIDAEDVGGTQARTLYLDVASGSMWLNKNGQQHAVLPPAGIGRRTDYVAQCAGS